MIAPAAKSVRRVHRQSVGGECRTEREARAPLALSAALMPGLVADLKQAF